MVRAYIAVVANSSVRMSAGPEEPQIGKEPSAEHGPDSGSLPQSGLA